MVCEKHDKLTGDVSKLNEIVSNLKYRVEDFSGMKDLITRLVVLQEEREKNEIRWEKDRQKQAETLVQLETTLVKINHNLDFLNTKIEETNKKVEETNIRVEETGKKVDETGKKVVTLEVNLKEIQSKQKNNVELTKGRLAFYGIVIASIFTFLGVVIPLILK